MWSVLVLPELEVVVRKVSVLIIAADPTTTSTQIHFRLGYSDVH